MKLFSFSFRIYATAALQIDPAARRARSARPGGTPEHAAKIIVLPQKNFCKIWKPSSAVLQGAHFNVCCPTDSTSAMNNKKGTGYTVNCHKLEDNIL